MECPNCEYEMTKEEVLVSKTTSPEEEDLWLMMWVCDICDHTEPIEIETEDYEYQ